MRKPEFIYVSYIGTTPEKPWQAPAARENARRHRFAIPISAPGIEGME